MGKNLDGSSIKFKKWSILSPEVFDGSSIYVGKIKESEPFDYTEYAKEITAIIASIAQTVTLVYLAR